VTARPLARARTWHAQRTPGAQAADELALESSTTLDVESLVDRLVADPHRPIMGKTTGGRREICSGLQAFVQWRS